MLSSSSGAERSDRDSSLSSAFDRLRLVSGSSTEEPTKTSFVSPSRLPRPVTPAPVFLVPCTPSPKKSPKSRQRSPARLVPFLTRDSNTQDWDQQAYHEQFAQYFSELDRKLSSNVEASSSMKEAIELYKNQSMSLPEICSSIQALLSSSRSVETPRLTHLLVNTVNELERCRAELNETNTQLRSDLETTRSQVLAGERDLRDLKRDHEIELDEIERQKRNEIETLRLDSRKEVDSIRSDHWEELRGVRRRLEDELESERNQRIQAVNQVSTQGALEKQRTEVEIEERDREIRLLKQDLEQLRASIEKELAVSADLRRDMSTATSNISIMDTSNQALRAKIEYLESDSKSQSEAYAEMERQMREAIERAQELQDKLRAEESIRRKLHNQVQELKGNIRVFCRVRPILEGDSSEDNARITFPDVNGDAKDIEIKGPEEKSSLGTDMTRTNNFSFDRVFGPSCQNQQVFDELSQLVQSALDGYNVCIFCYGQTGSGKTYTMSSEDGMIPRAVHQIYKTAKGLEERGWTYHMEGSFIEGT